MQKQTKKTINTYINIQIIYIYKYNKPNPLKQISETKQQNLKTHNKPATNNK